MGAASVFLFALLTAAATGLGAVPFAFAKHPTRRWLGASNAVAAGLMLAASFGLFYEGMNYGPLRALAGALLGLAFIVVARRSLRQEEHPAVFASMSGLDARKALLIVGVMTIHSFTEGVGIGVSFGGGQALGLFISLALAVHNVPEGLAISLVLVPRGVGWVRAAAWSIFSSLPQPLMAVPAFFFVELFRPLLPFGLGFAAGAMIWMVFSELVPDANEEAPSDLVAVVITVSVVAMVAFPRDLGENILLFGAYPAERAGEIEGRLESVLGSTRGRALSAAEAHRAWGERFFPVTPSVLTPRFTALSREVVSLVDFPEKLEEVEDRTGKAAVQGTVARSREVLLLSLEDHEEGAVQPHGYGAINTPDKRH